MSEVQQLLKTYDEMYHGALGESAPIVWGRDGKLAKELLATYPYAKLAKWLRDFFASTDRFIREGGFTFPSFHYNLGKLIAAESHVQASEKSLRSMAGIFGTPPVRTPIRDALAFLAVEFRTEVDSPQRRSYERVLDDVKDLPDVLMEGAQLLVNQAAAGRKFYPMPMAHDWKAACAKVIEVMRMKAWIDATKHCDHPRYFEELTAEDGTSRLERCSCWKRGKLAMDATCKPLALPAVSDEGDAA